MTRTYAARRLLEHGPLSYAEMLEITRWRASRLESTLVRLERQGHIRRFVTPGRHRNVYRLAA